MPTGYTAELYDGKDISFKEFVLQCARAFGACIMLRDEPLSSDIPEFQPNDYNKERIEDIKAEIVDMEALSLAAATVRFQEEHQKAVDSLNKSIQTQIGQYTRYAAMKGQVERWEPPTEDHKGLKTFMIEQLETSIKFDCYYAAGHPYAEDVKYPELKTGEQWRQDKLAGLRRDLVYHEKQHQEEINRTEARNLWVKRLKKSLEE